MGEGSESNVIKIAAGVGVTLLLVLLVFGLYTFFSKKVEGLKNQAGQLIDSVAIAAYTEKDGEIVSGSTVLAFIGDRETFDDQICIIVKTKRNTTGTEYVYASSDLNKKLSTEPDGDETKRKANARNKSHADYILPSGRFLATVHKDDNGTIKDITFAQQ